MAQNYSLPKPTEPLLDQFGKVSVPWYNYLRTRFGDGAAEEIIASIEAQIADLLARVEALEEGESAIISGPESVRVVGTLAGGLVQLTLEGDDRSPPPTHYYGTNAVEVKGFHPVSDTVEVAAGELTKSIAVDGVTTFGLEDVPDGGGGALLRVAFDAKGRKTDSSPAELGDLADVDLVSSPPADGDALIYDGVAGEWIPGSGGGGGSGRGYGSVRLRRPNSDVVKIFGDETAQGNAAAAAVTANQVRYYPFALSRAIAISSIGASVSSLSVGNKARVAIYNNDGDATFDRPGTILVESGDLDTSTTGIKYSSVSITLNPGVIYWAAFICTAASFHQWQGNQASTPSWFGRASIAAGPITYAFENIGPGWTIMPSNAGTLSYQTAGNYPMVLFQEAGG